MIRGSVSCFCLLAAFLIVGCAQPVVVPPPPPPPSVISRVTAAKKVFLSNGGTSEGFMNGRIGGPNGIYNALYASLKQWGRFQLVDTPTQADLIFEITATQPLADVEHTGNGLGPKSYTVTAYPAMFNLDIYDPSTKADVYEIVSPAGQGGTSQKGRIAFANAIAALTDRVKALVAVPAPTQNP